MIILYILVVLFLMIYYLRRICKNNVILFLSSTKKGVTKTPEEFKILYDVVYFDTTDGVELCGWFIESVNNSDETFIICGDGFTTKSDLLHTTLFLREKYNLFYFDMRGTGNSKGVYKFGFSEHRDIEAAYNFLLNMKEESSKRIFIYTCGFTVMPLVLADGVIFNGAVIKEPYTYPFDEIKRRLESRFKFMICKKAIYDFFSNDISKSVVDTKKINYPTIFISNKVFETSSKTINLSTEEELKKTVFDFFKH